MVMNKNREIIISLCSYLCVGEDVSPYTNGEWANLYSKLKENNKEPQDILTFSDEDYNKYLDYSNDEINRIKRLLSRTGSMSFELEKLASRGINIITCSDDNYPKIYKDKLGIKCPPLFYYSGNLDLMNGENVGFVGSRSIGEADLEFTKEAVKYFIKKGYQIVSGGAKGVDRTSTGYALELGGNAVEILSDSMGRRLKDLEVVNAIRDNRMLVLSERVPQAPFDVGFAMQRNKYIYCSSILTVVVKSDYNKGGTWAGAKEAIKHNYTNVYVWDNDYLGNQELIKLGANRIDRLNKNNGE